ncbi:MAG: quinone-dependent dihydroorotate dehydrogenase [Candidatus Thalassarchaeaceae archaeon]|nr:quinone-dependent dihydroorotate dehydrogenase [Candidatus Thalassarchaeaceae archaeon]
MGLPYRSFVRPILKVMDSEKAHKNSINILSKIDESTAGQRLLNSIYGAPDEPITVLNNLFRHPLGLAAGFDKGADVLSSWPSLGFSWGEYGGVTRFPQDGNPKPRMFRAEKEHALINRMGLNNPGAINIKDKLNQRKSAGNWPSIPIAANIGRSSKTSNDNAPQDYSETLEILWDYADIFVLNVSSPNTPNLRELQNKSYLDLILSECMKVRDNATVYKPILLKLSPDRGDDQIIDSVDTSIRHNIDGFIATNTTIKKPIPMNTKSRKILSQEGGLSGRPLHNRSLEVIKLIHGHTNGNYPIIGVGGIESPDTAWSAITSGASLMQLYSSLVFQGPSVVSNIVKGIKKRRIDEGFENISEAVGYNSV